MDVNGILVFLVSLLRSGNFFRSDWRCAALLDGGYKFYNGANSFIINSNYIDVKTRLPRGVVKIQFLDVVVSCAIEDGVLSDGPITLFISRPRETIGRRIELRENLLFSEGIDGGRPSCTCIII